MKTVLSILSLLLLGSASAIAQISSDDFGPLAEAMRTQSYQAAYELSGTLLDDVDDDDEEGMTGMVRYIRLFSGAALIASEELSYEDFEPVASAMQGAFLLMPGHPTQLENEDDLAFNTNVIEQKGDTVKVSTVATNEDGTSIYAFEYFYLDESVDPEELDGSITRCGGRLEKVELNPNESTIWIMRLTVTDAKIQMMKGK